MQVPSLVAAAETVLTALGQLADAAQSGAASPAARSALPWLVVRLRALLEADDARAEDALDELAALLAGGAHGELLALMRRRVEDLEYEAALAPLAQLAASLELNMEDAA